MCVCLPESEKLFAIDTLLLITCRFVATSLQSDLRVEVDSTEFHLHKV